MKNAKFLGANLSGAANYKDRMTRKQKIEMIDFESDLDI